MNMRPAWLIVLALAVSVSMVSAGCGSKGDDQEKKEVKKVAEEQEVAEAEMVTLPEDYPADLPACAGAELEMVHKMDPEKLWHMEWVSKMGLAETAGHLKSQLETNGWSIQEQVGSAEMEVLAIHAKKGERDVTYDMRLDERTVEDFSETYPVTWIRADYYPMGSAAVE